MPEACTEVYKEKRQPEKAPSQLYMQLTHTVKPRIALHLPMTVRDLFDHEPREYFPTITLRRGPLSLSIFRVRHVRADTDVPRDLYLNS
jgi:hypothetical protein